MGEKGIANVRASVEIQSNAGDEGLREWTLNSIRPVNVVVRRSYGNAR